MNNPYAFREIGIGHYPLGIYDVGDKRVEDLMKLGEENLKGKLLYVHIPFCQSICPFCPYPKAIHNEGVKYNYLTALMREIDLYAQQPHIAVNNIEAIYFGGGTPSILTESEIEALFKKLKDALNIETVEEITFEGNPASFTREKVKLLKSLGVNRISLGVQTFNDALGERLGLIQKEKNSVDAIEWCKKEGIDNISIDLMYNLPGQTVEEWVEDIEKVAAYGIHHVSLFPLKVIPVFKLFKLIQAGEVSPCGNMEFEEELFETAATMFEDEGYKPESTYDFVLPGKEHIYSRKHFKGFMDILALGMGAFGEINGCVYQNATSITEYMGKVSSSQLPVVKWYQVTEKDLPNRYLAMGFRLLEVDRLDFFNKFGVDPEIKFKEIFEKLYSNGLLEAVGQKIRLTKRKGVFWGNNICKEFCIEIFRNAFPK